MDIPDRGNIDYFDPTRLLHALRRDEVKKVLFVGDSITEQVLAYFLCDMSRIDNVTVNSSSRHSASITVDKRVVFFDKVTSLLAKEIYL